MAARGGAGAGAPSGSRETPQNARLGVVSRRGEHLVLGLSDISDPGESAAAARRQRLEVEGSGPYGTLVDGDLGEWLRRLGPAQTKLLMRLRNRRGSALKCGGVSSPDGRCIVFALAGSHTLYEFSAYNYADRLSRIGSAELWRFRSGGRDWSGWWLAGTLNSSGTVDGIAEGASADSRSPSFNVPTDVCLNAVPKGWPSPGVDATVAEQPGVVVPAERGGAGDDAGQGAGGGGSGAGAASGSPSGHADTHETQQDPPALDLFVADRGNRSVRHVIGRPGRARVTTVHGVLSTAGDSVKPERVASTPPYSDESGSTLWVLLSNGSLRCCALSPDDESVIEATEVQTEIRKFTLRTLSPLTGASSRGCAVLVGVPLEPSNSGNTDLVIVRKHSKRVGLRSLTATRLRLEHAHDGSPLTLKRPMAVELPIKNVCAFAVVTSGRMCVACLPAGVTWGHELTLKAEPVPCGGDATGVSEDSYAMPWGEVRTLSTYTTATGGLGLVVSDADARVFRVTFPAQLAPRPLGRAASVLPCLVDNEELCDVTFIVEGRPIHAVSALLAARSGYFRSMFFSSGLRESATPRTGTGGSVGSPAGRAVRRRRSRSHSGPRKKARRGVRDSAASSDGDGDGLQETKTSEHDDDDGNDAGDDGGDSDERDLESVSSAPPRFVGRRPDVEIRDASYAAFRAMIAFLCTDSLALPADDWVNCIVEVMCLATLYRLPSLHGACMEFIEQRRRADPEALISLMPVMLPASYERRLSQLCRYCVNLLRSRLGRAWLGIRSNRVVIMRALAPHPELGADVLNVLL